MAATATTLRVLVDDPPEAGRQAAWALFDASDRRVSSGTGTPATWPAAERREAVIAARRGRIVTLTLPPVPAGRLEAAARFALEDQLADVPEAIHVALANERGNNRLRVAIVADSWMSAFVAASQRIGIDWDRVLLESDLALTPARGWRWCAASVSQPGFVRTDAGSTIAVGPAQTDAPPAELSLALVRGGADAPPTVRVDAEGVSAALLAGARARTGVEFVAGTPWRWADAVAGAFTGAIDLLSGRFDTRSARPSLHLGARLRPGLIIVAIALGLHIVATVGQWLWLHWEIASVGRELGAVARLAVPGLSDATPAAAAAALFARDRDLKHRAGQLADDDYLPLLARAAPALSTLPAGAVRSLSYADYHLLFDLQKIDPSLPAVLPRELQRANLTAMSAPTASGARLRVGLN